MLLHQFQLFKKVIPSGQYYAFNVVIRPLHARINGQTKGSNLLIIDRCWRQGPHTLRHSHALTTCVILPHHSLPTTHEASTALTRLLGKYGHSLGLLGSSV